MRKGEELRFQKLEVRRAAAFRAPGFQVEGLAPGINVIFGPNASGKTTLARSMETILWPDAPALERSELVGTLRLGGHQWRVEVEGNRVREERNGLLVPDRLPVPPKEVRDRYYLCLHELLEADNQSFAEVIMRESVGGYDVRGAAQQQGFTNPTLRKIGLTDHVRDARTKWQEALKKLESLHVREGHLQVLKKELKVKDQLARRKSLLDVAHAFHKAREAFLVATAEIEKFPTNMEKLRGDALEEAKKWAEEGRKASESWTDAKARIEEFKRALGVNPLSREALPEGFLRAQKERIEELKRREDAQSRLEVQLAEARAHREEVGRLIGADESYQEFHKVDIEVIRKLEKLAQDADAIRGKRSALEALEDLIGVREHGEANPRLEEAIRLLQQWLRSPGAEDLVEPEEMGDEKSRLVVLICALLVTVVSLVLFITVHAAWMALLLIAVALGWAFFAMAKKAVEKPENPREIFRKEFEKLSLRGPEKWEVTTVESCLRTLEEARADQVVAKEKSQLLESKAREREVCKESAAKVEEDCRALTADLGLSLSEMLEDSPARLYWFVMHLQDWQKAQIAAVAAEEELKTARKMAAEDLAALQDALRSYGVLAIEDAAAARAAVETLENHKRDVQSTHHQLAAAKKDFETATREKSKVEDGRRALFEGLGLEVGDEAGLKELVARFEDYQAVRKEVQDTRAAMEYEERRLRGAEAFVEELLEATQIAIYEELGELESTLSGRDDLIKEIQDIETQIKGAKNSNNVEALRGNYEELREQLRRQRESTFEQIVGHHVAEFLLEETRDRDRPTVFHRASELFTAITRGRYRLAFEDGDKPRFRAVDRVREIGQSLDELSSGTRVQLLLAVRVAFVEQQEQGVKLPLVLDETLANSDDLRAEAIMEAIEGISAAGRQVFYLTAQEDEVSKWRQRSRDSAVAYRFIELGGGQGQGDHRKVYDLKTLPVMAARVPSPEGLTHVEYGALLKVPRGVDPYGPAGETHLWFLSEDTAVLYGLLKHSIARWGQFQALEETGALDALGVAASERERIKAARRALDAFLRAWKVGRGKPVTRAVLEASGAVSDTFIDRVARCCDEQKGDAQALLQALDEGKVSRFHTTKREELAEFLKAQGYLDSQLPLSREEIWVRVLAAVAPYLASGRLDEGCLRRLIARAAGRRVEEVVGEVVEV